jgi:hypothetical protein
MASTRAFSTANIPQKAEDYHGSCKYVRTSPDIAPKGVPSVNVELTFNEAMRLSVAIQAAILGLNRHNRTTKLGRKMGLCISIKTDTKSIAVLEQAIKS